MNLDELQSVQARERQSSDLQHLRSSFYREVGEFVRQLTEERDRAVEEVEDPFSSPEVRRLTDDIETAEQTVEAIYERRVGKVVKKASIAAAGMPVEEEGLTAEEETLFEDLVRRIEENRQSVLSILSGDGSAGAGEYAPASAPTSDTVGDDDGATDGDGTREGRDGGDGEDGAEGVDAASLMGNGSEASPAGDTSEDPDADASHDEGRTEVPPEPAPPAAEPGEPDPEPDHDADVNPDDEAEANPDHDAEANPDHDADDPEAAGGPVETDVGSEDGTIPGQPRTTVRITADVGRMVGADNRDYDLGEEDVVSLPEPNADVLVEKDAAERLE